jgi:hypothetical protein
MLPRYLAVVRRLFLIALASLLSSALILSAQTQTPPQDFSIVLLPDTQYYSESHPQIFQQQTQWIVANRATWNIQFVLGEGDIVNAPEQSLEWANADAAVKILDQAKMPYVLALGNHDYDGVVPASRGTTAYNQWFGVQRYSALPWYGGHLGTTNENFYGSFKVNGQRYIVLALEYYPRDEALQWADALMTANPDAQFLITTHSFEYTDGVREDTCDTQDMRSSTGRNPQRVWETVLKNHDNVQLVVSGHVIGNNTAHRTDLGVNGNVVNQIFTNFQNLTNGGNGYLRILKFRPALNVIEVYTYSPTLKQSLTTPAFQFTLPLTNAGNEATTGALEGKVRTLGCTNIAGAQVTAGDTTVTTDANGYFKIPGLEPNSEVPISVTAESYTPQSSSNDVYAGYANQTNFYLTSTISPSCTLGVTNPSVTICSPAASATVTSPVHVNASTYSSTVVKYIQLYVDGVFQKTLYNTALDMSLPMANGTHRITVQALLNSNAYIRSTVNITVGTPPPPPPPPPPTGVTLASPANGAVVSNPVAVKATATSTVAITFIELWIDGVKKTQVNGNAMNVTVTLATGSHRITTQAKDANGVYYKASSIITVQ